ncbi:1448_t:CDS:2, partial [Cetraspora pellucida]
QALRHVVDGLKDSRFSGFGDNINRFSDLTTDSKLHKIFSNWYAIENLPLYLQDEANENSYTDAICLDKNFINIALKEQWSTKKLMSIGLSNTLSGNHSLFQDLFESYKRHLGLRSALLHKKLKFYNYITYTILNSKDSIRLKLHIGDIVELAENSEGIIYARIRAIFMHQANDGLNYAFFQFEKFQELNLLDPVLECPFYK